MSVTRMLQRDVKPLRLWWRQYYKTATDCR